MADGRIAFIELAKTRRSVRRFSREPVPREDSRLMLEAATHAPSGGDGQPWLFVAVEDAEVISSCRMAIERELESLASKLPGVPGGDLARAEVRFRAYSLFFSEAPLVFFAFCDDEPTPFERVLVAAGSTAAEARMKSGCVNLASVAAAVENLLLAAHSMGYGACWMNPPSFAATSIGELLGVEPRYRLAAIVPVGKPAEAPPRRRPRRDGAVRFVPHRSPRR
jgi:nitroreductase